MRTVIAHVVQVHYIRSGVCVCGWVGGGAWHAVASRYGSAACKAATSYGEACMLSLRVAQCLAV
jgi:hypothetical protein